MGKKKGLHQSTLRRYVEQELQKRAPSLRLISLDVTQPDAVALVVQSKLTKKKGRSVVQLPPRHMQEDKRRRQWRRQCKALARSLEAAAADGWPAGATPEQGAAE